MTPNRKETLLNKLREFHGDYVTRKEFDSTLGHISFISNVVPSLRPPLKHLIDIQTVFRRPDKIHMKYIPISNRVRFIVRWVRFCLQRWGGSQRIASCIWNGPELTIWCDIGTKRLRIWGVGAFCYETGQYVSQPWDKVTYLQSTVESGDISVPFLETYGVIASALTLGKPNTRIEIFCDCEPAVIALARRWCKANYNINEYIGTFDLFCTERSMYVQVTRVDRAINPAHHLSYGNIP